MTEAAAAAEAAGAQSSKRALRRGLLSEPVADYIAAIDALRSDGIRGLLFATIALIGTWFVYVPLHELLHAFGCVATGGSVTRLEIAPEYGGALLATVFPFVVSGSSYAGQLTGFDTHGNDGIYLATVLAPFVLTIFVGVPLLKHVARPSTPRAWRPWLLGSAALLAYAPLVSLIGDYYEAGSIIVSRAARALDPSLSLVRWRSDDVLKLVSQLADQGVGARAGAIDWLGVSASLAVGFILALLTYRAGALVARALSSR